MTLIIAHRGFSGQYLDNSYEALFMALDMNVDMIELDIRLCKSGDLIAYHDWRIGKDLIHQCSFDYLKRTYQIMSLNDIFQVYHLYMVKQKTKLLLDIKTPHYEVNNTLEQSQQLVNIINEYIEDEVINYDSIICSSFNKQILGEIYTLNANIKLGYITSYIEDNLESIPKDYPIYCISIDYNEISKEKLEKLTARNIYVYVYTVNCYYDLCNFMEIGIDGIITNHPDKILKILGKTIPIMKPFLPINYYPPKDSYNYMDNNKTISNIIDNTVDNTVDNTINSTVDTNHIAIVRELLRTYIADNLKN